MDFIVGIAAQTMLLHSSFDGYGDSNRLYAAVEENGFFVQGGIENGKSRIKGQPWIKSDAVTVGAGYRVDITDRFSFGVSGGWWEPVTTSLDPAVRDEIAFTYLVSRHHLDGLKPIPLQQIINPDTGTPDYAPCNDWGGGAFPDQCYDSEAWVEGGWYADIGFTVKAIDGLELGINYRYLRPDSYIAVFDPERRANGAGWWEERGLLNYDTVNLSVQWRF